VIPLVPTDIDRFTNQLRTIADRYSTAWRKIETPGPHWGFFDCYYGKDGSGQSDDDSDAGRFDDVIVGTLCTLDFVASHRGSSHLRQDEQLCDFELRIERIPHELWVGENQIEDDDIELLFQQTYPARSA
jgi:hypothetical protein